MGQAAIYSLALYREKAQKELFREECHRQLDLFLDALEPQMSQSHPTLEALTAAIFCRRNDLMGELTALLVKQTHADLIEQEYTTCPHCGKALKARGKHPRTVSKLSLGRSTLSVLISTALIANKASIHSMARLI
jgi:hypothetical protein